MADGGMFPVDPSQFVKDIPSDLLNMRRVSSSPDGYGGGYSSGSYSSGGYSSGGYSSGGYSRGPSKPAYKKTWRR